MAPALLFPTLVLHSHYLDFSCRLSIKGYKALPNSLLGHQSPTVHTSIHRHSNKKNKTSRHLSFRKTFQPECCTSKLLSLFLKCQRINQKNVISGTVQKGSCSEGLLWFNEGSMIFFFPKLTAQRAMNRKATNQILDFRSTGL